jgi:hypothetical protein
MYSLSYCFFSGCVYGPLTDSVPCWDLSSPIHHLTALLCALCSALLTALCAALCAYSLPYLLPFTVLFNALFNAPIAAPHCLFTALFVAILLTVRSLFTGVNLWTLLCRPLIMYHRFIALFTVLFNVFHCPITDLTALFSALFTFLRSIHALCTTLQ